MLIEFKIKNFRSFRDNQTLSMAANNATELQDNTFNSGISGLPNLLHSAVIYGPNAAGKSNTLLALRFMKNFVLSSAKDTQKDEDIQVTPFLFNQQTSTQSSEFEVIFIQNGVRYQYGFAANQERITNEWLLAYPAKRGQRWFEREYYFDTKQENWYFGSKLKGHRQIWKESTRKNALFLSTAIQLNSEQLKPVFDWFNERLVIGKSINLNPTRTLAKCKTEDKQKILEFMNVVDISIADLNVETKKLSIEDLPIDIPQDLKQDVLRKIEEKELNFTKVQFFHLDNFNQKIPLPLEEQSDGTQMLFKFAGIFLDILRDGKILIIDELNNSLHPKLVVFLVNLFHDPELNKNHAQLIFTTHDTTVLDKEILRRDQVWFAEKDETDATQIYPLSDFSPRKEEALQKGYLNGRYGALPYVRKFRNNGN